jgi:molybdate transport system ATP-binding protein
MSIEIDILMNLTARRGSFALEVSFFSQADMTVLFGPSGAGKSLTLQAIAGVRTPRAGRIRAGGRLLFDSEQKINVPARERNVGYLFQDYALFPHLTVRENIGFGLRRGWMGRLGRDERERVNELMEIFELVAWAEGLPRDLSGGQRQRTALARALVRRPDLLLLDEPFSALDPLLRAKMRSELLKVRSRFKIPVILITHDPADVDVLADTLVLLEAGHVRDVRSFLRREGEVQPAVSLFPGVQPCLS